MARITSTATYGIAGSPPPGMGDKSPWTVTLRRNGKRMTVKYFMGYGLEGRKPDTREVMETLISDAVLIENAGTFEFFTRELGVSGFDDTKTELIYRRAYRLTRSQTERLKKFLGADYYDAIDYHKATWLDENVEQRRQRQTARMTAPMRPGVHVRKYVRRRRSR